MSNGNGHHWSKFCWRDWSADKALHPCSLAAKGFWIEMLCIMHEATPVGHLTLGGKPATIRQMAANAFCSEREAAKYLAELEEAGVFSRTTEGTIYSRRMVKDAAASEAGREHIAKRWNGAKLPDPPNRVPNRVPTSRPNEVATSQAYRQPGRHPITKSQNSELELEAERPTPYPHGVGEGTPAEPGTPPAGRRSNSSNPRAEGTNPRNLGTNPRATGRREGFVSGGIAVLADRLRQRAEARHDDDLTDEHSYFVGLRIVDGSRG